MRVQLCAGLKTKEKRKKFIILEKNTKCPSLRGEKKAARQLHVSRSLRLSTPEKTNYLETEAPEKELKKKKVKHCVKNNGGKPVGK